MPGDRKRSTKKRGVGIRQERCHSSRFRRPSKTKGHPCGLVDVAAHNYAVVRYAVDIPITQLIWQKRKARLGISDLCEKKRRERRDESQTNREESSDR